MATTLSTEPEYHLIGSWTRYSSWTARVEVILEYFNIPYTATHVHISEVKKISPTGLVPILKWGDIYISQSLSIAEFLAESHPEKNLWPKDRQLRALARSAAAEMFSGFPALRNTCTTNFVAKYEGEIPLEEDAKREVERVLTLWSEARKAAVKRLGELGEVDEGFLFGGFSISDAFFWPVLWRFRTYNLPLDTATPEALKWMGKMWSEPALKKLGREYFRQAEIEETKVEKYDDIFKGNEDVKFGKFSEEWEFEAGE